MHGRPLCFTRVLCFFFERHPRMSPNGIQPTLATCFEVSEILKGRAKFGRFPTLPPETWGPKTDFSDGFTMTVYETHYRQTKS